VQLVVGKIGKNMIEIPIEIGDLILGGKFKNKKIIVKEIGKDKFGHPTINGRQLLTVRIDKFMKKPIVVEENIIEDILEKRKFLKGLLKKHNLEE
jgi:hypothetical protein